MKMYAFRDIKTGYMEPFLQLNDQIALRTFTATLRNTRNIMREYKEDIELWCVAEFNEELGEVLPEKRYLIGGKDITID